MAYELIVKRQDLRAMSLEDLEWLTQDTHELHRFGWRAVVKELVRRLRAAETRKSRLDMPVTDS